MITIDIHPSHDITLDHIHEHVDHNIKASVCVTQYHDVIFDENGMATVENDYQDADVMEVDFWCQTCGKYVWTGGDWEWA